MDESLSALNQARMNKHEFKSGATTFAQQQITLSDTPLYFPEKFETVFVGLYFIFLPYLTGIVFLFIFVAKGDINLFGSLNHDSSFLFCWCIGYECLAGLAILWIIKSAFTFSLQNKGSRREFKRPRL